MLANMAGKDLLIIFAMIMILMHGLVEASTNKNKKDVNRKSIVFDIKTPKVFYCQQEKPSDYSKIIVKSKPLEKLCEFEGEPKPKNAPSDCYNDVDETIYACDEKKRILLRLGTHIESATDQQGNAFDLDDLEQVIS